MVNYIEKICLFCNKEFKVKDYKRGKFCNKNCMHEFNRIKLRSKIPSTSNRFYSQVLIPDNENGCMNWVGFKDKYGYGEISINKISVRVHRYSYELHFGEFKKCLNVCHHCDNPSCVNPNHLWVGTNQDNMNDKMKKGRYKGNKGKTYKKLPILVDD